MRKCLLVLAVLIVSLISFTPDASAYSSPHATGFGAKATSMGGAFCAIADDASAVYYNPAGLAQLKGTSINLGHSAISPHIRYRDKYRYVDDEREKNYKAEDDPMDSTINPFVASSSDLGTESLVFGFGVLLPYGHIIRIKIEHEDSRRLHWYNEEFHRFLTYSGLAYQVTPNLSVGLGCGVGIHATMAGLLWENIATELNLTIGSLEPLGIKIKIGSVEVTDITIPDIELEVDSINLYPIGGLLYRPTEKLSLGLAYRAETRDTIPVRVPGTFYIDLLVHALGEAIEDVVVEDVPVSSGMELYFDYIFPQQAVFGLAYKPIERLTLACDLIWTQWSIIDYGYCICPTCGVRAPNQTGTHCPKCIECDTNMNFVRIGNWKDTYVPHFGIEYRPARTFYGMELAFRAGYYYEPSPIPEDWLANEYVDFDRFVYSAGVGLSKPGFPVTVDIYGQFIHLKNRRVHKDAYVCERQFGPEGSEETVTTTIYKEKDFIAGESVYNTGITITYHF